MRLPVHVEPLDFAPDQLVALRRGAMAKFCGSLTPQDWLALETLEPRLRNGLLVLAVQQLLKKRTRGR